MSERGDITVRVLPPNARALEVSVPPGSTVRDVLDKGGVSLDKAASIRIGGESVSLEQEVTHGQTLAIAPNVIGG
jgi:hypothetical protein